MRGLSPHARGNPAGAHDARGRARSIPARAGQPPHHAQQAHISRVYPRTRGATGVQHGGKWLIEGLSPHARGNRWCVAYSIVKVRSIPARAGQPIIAVARANEYEVYPRTRGATMPKPWCLRAIAGLSPHARGNLADARKALYKHRSIPARAGQPTLQHGAG